MLGRIQAQAEQCWQSGLGCGLPFFKQSLSAGTAMYPLKTLNVRQDFAREKLGIGRQLSSDQRVQRQTASV